MVKVDTIEGVIDDRLWLHYDMQNDVLYLHCVADRDASTYSEETEEGLLLVRREDNDNVAGMTIVNFWKRYGGGPLPDSIQALAEAIGPWADKLAAA
jgi:hypothetical protein